MELSLIPSGVDATTNAKAYVYSNVSTEINYFFRGYHSSPPICDIFWGGLEEKGEEETLQWVHGWSHTLDSYFCKNQQTQKVGGQPVGGCHCFIF